MFKISYCSLAFLFANFSLLYLALFNKDSVHHLEMMFIANYSSF